MDNQYPYTAGDPATNRRTGVNYDANGNPTEGKIYGVGCVPIGEVESPQPFSFFNNPVLTPQTGDQGSADVDKTTPLLGLPWSLPDQMRLHGRGQPSQPPPIRPPAPKRTPPSSTKPTRPIEPNPWNSPWAKPWAALTALRNFRTPFIDVEMVGPVINTRALRDMSCPPNTCQML